MDIDVRSLLVKAAPVVVGLSIVGFVLGVPGNLAALLMFVGIAMIIFLPKKVEED